MSMIRALCVGAEQVFLETQVAMHCPRMKTLQSIYILERNDVNRMENGVTSFFSRLRGDYDEKLEKERKEMGFAKEEMDRIAAMLDEAEKRLQELQAEGILLTMMEPIGVEKLMGEANTIGGKNGGLQRDRSGNECLFAFGEGSDAYKCSAEWAGSLCNFRDAC